VGGMDWRRPPGWLGRPALAAVLVALLGWEVMAGAAGRSVAQVAVWAGAAVVSGCAVTGRWFALPWRAAVAATVSWVTTVALLTLGEVRHPWGPAEVIALGVLCAQVIRTLPLRPAVALGAALSTAVIVAPARGGHPGIAGALLGVAVVGLLAACAYLRISGVQRVAAVTRARAGERLAIARELHDLVAHHVTGLVIEAQAMRHDPADPIAVGQLLDDVERSGTQAMVAMRRLVSMLRDDSAAPRVPTPGLTQIGEDARDLSRRLGISVDVRIDPELVESMPDTVAVGVHRIVREALTNVRKHAQNCTRVEVRVTQALSGGIDVEVVDDGRPVPARVESSGYGLVGLAERLDELGGILRTGPAPGVGWRLYAHLPAERS
jgi:signal transduction histidine kinase